MKFLGVYIDLVKNIIINRSDLWRSEF